MTLTLYKSVGSPLPRSVRSICCYHQCGTCCWAPCGATPCLINHKPCAGALTTHNLVAYHLPSCILGSLCPIIKLTGTRQHTNDSCQWSFEPAPFFNLNSSLHISPTKLFGFLSSRVHKFWTAGAKVSVFARLSQQLPTTSDVKWVCRPWRRKAESRGSRTERKRTVVLLSILSPSSFAFGQCLSEGNLTVHGGVLWVC